MKILKYAQHKTGAYYTHEKVDSGIRICRQGGGFTHCLTPAQFAQDFTLVDRLPNSHVLAQFELDSHEEKFWGWHNPDYNWNGWATPTFTEEQFKKVLASLCLTYDFTNEKLLEDGYMDGVTDYIEDIEVIVTLKDNVHHYDLNGWCWTVVEPVLTREEYITSLGAGWSKEKQNNMYIAYAARLDDQHGE